MKELTCELNGIKYLLVQYLLYNSNKSKAERLFKKYECIIQGVSEVSRGGWFYSAYIIINILVPERYVIAFNNDSN